VVQKEAVYNNPSHKAFFRGLNVLAPLSLGKLNHCWKDSFRGGNIPKVKELPIPDYLRWGWCWKKDRDGSVLMFNALKILEKSNNMRLLPEHVQHLKKVRERKKTQSWISSLELQDDIIEKLKAKGAEHEKETKPIEKYAPQKNEPVYPNKIREEIQRETDSVSNRRDEGGVDIEAILRKVIQEEEKVDKEPVGESEQVMLIENCEEEKVDEIRKKQTGSKKRKLEMMTREEETEEKTEHLQANLLNENPRGGNENESKGDKRKELEQAKNKINSLEQKIAFLKKERQEKDKMRQEARIAFLEQKLSFFEKQMKPVAGNNEPIRKKMKIQEEIEIIEVSDDEGEIEIEIEEEERREEEKKTNPRNDKSHSDGGIDQSQHISSEITTTKSKGLINLLFGHHQEHQPHNQHEYKDNRERIKKEDSDSYLTTSSHERLLSISGVETDVKSCDDNHEQKEDDDVNPSDLCIQKDGFVEFL